MKTVIIATYAAFWSMRQSFISAGWGAVSQCKHNPTCGEYFIERVEKEGALIGIKKGFSRLIRCW